MPTVDDLFRPTHLSLYLLFVEPTGPIFDLRISDMTTFTFSRTFLANPAVHTILRGNWGRGWESETDSQH
jgi:hypothetical protein